ncbi:MAG: hypothetical protein H5T73_05695 [Actinobacteria bacterium]|nr:hypothetical protein [Actinomycetota bacterium]
MKKLLVLSMILGLCVALVAVTGCGKKETSVKLPGGEEVQVEEDGGKVTIESEEGRTTYESGEKEPTEKDLGVPVYPDADYVPGSGGTASATSGGQASVYAGGQWTTKDDFDEVVGWYSGKLGEPMYTTSEGGTKSAGWMIGDMEENFTTVTVEEEAGKVTITIGKIGSK